MIIDSLDIQISASMRKTTDAIKTLTNKLDKVTASLGRVNATGLSQMALGVNKLANAMNNFAANTKTADFSRLSKNIEKLSSIPTGNMQSIASALKPLADGVSTLSSVNFDNKNLQSMINSLTRLSNSNIGNLSSVNFTAISDSIRNLSASLSGAEKVQQSTISMTNAIAKLADSGANIPIVSSSLAQLGDSLNKFMTTMSNALTVTTETTAFTQAVAQLANAGAKTTVTASNLGVLASELNAFMATMSNAPAVSSGTIQMTQALANLASQGGKTGSATKALQQVFSSTEASGVKLSNTVKKLSSSVNRLGSTIKKASSKVKSFRKEILSVLGIVGGVYGAIRMIQKSLDISSDLVEVQNVVDATFGDMTYKVEDFAKTSIKQFGMSELALKQYASRFQAMGAAMGISRSSISSANKNLSKLTNGYVGLSNSLSDVSLNLTKLTADLASFYNMEQSDVAQDLESIFTGQTRPLRTYGLDLTQATLQEWALKQGLDADMHSMSQAEKTMLRYQYVLANTTAAQGDFAKTANTWANQVRILKQQFEQLASIVGTAFVNMLKPVVQSLNTAMAKVIEFAQTVVNALGKIFGWELEINTKGIAGDFSEIEDGIGGIADGIDDAVSAAKKFNKQLQGFDALNNLTTSDSGNIGDIGSAFENIGNLDLGNIVKAEGILDKFESEINTLYKLGNYLGESLKNFLDNIPWDTIKKNARESAEGLADLINGFVEVEGLGYSIGKTLAESINTAFEFLNAFVHSLHWESIGHFIADTLNGFFENIDWELIRDTFVTGFKGLANSINQFIKDFNWDNISNTISNAINIIAETVYTFFSTVNWSELGKNLGNQLMETIRKIDWEQIGKALGSVVQSAFDFLKSFIGQMDLSDIATALKNAFKGFINEVDTGDLALALTAMLGAAVAKISFKAVIAKLKYKLLADTLAQALGAGGENTAKAGLFGGLKTALTSLGGLSGILTTDLSTIMGAGTAAEIGTTLGVGILGSLGAALAGGLEAKFLDKYVIAPLLKPFDEETASFYENFKWFGEGGLFDQIIPDMSSFETFNQDLGFLLDGSVQMITDYEENPVFHALSDVLIGPWATAALTIPGHTKEISDDFENFKSLFSDGQFQSAVELWGDDIYNAFVTLGERQEETFGNIKQNISQTWENVKTNAFERWNEIKENLSDKWQSMKESALETFENMKKGISDTWDGLWTNIKGIINSILGGVEKMANGVVKGINTVIKAMNGLKFDIPDWVPGIGGNNFGFNIPEIKTVSIPKLATGGLVYKPTFLEAGEAGAEAILPLTNRAAMSQMVDEIMASAGGNSQFNAPYGAYGQNNSQTDSLLMSQNQLLQQQNELLRAILQKPNISNGEIFDAFKSEYQNESIRLYGTPTPGVPVLG